MKVTRRGVGGLALGLGAWSAGLRPARSEDGIIRAHGDCLIAPPKYGPDFAHFDYVNPNAPKGGAARYAVPSGFDSFHPFITRGDPPTGIGVIFDTLMAPTLDQGSAHYGLLAEWFEHPRNDGWVAFKLREQARWHDGRPVTVEDVIWTFKTLKEKGAPQYGLYYKNVTDARDMGGGVVRFDFDVTGNRELPHIMGQLTILPKHWWEARDFDQPSMEPQLGSGPYRIGAHDPARFIEYERVTEYWGGDLPVNVGRHNFDRLRYEVFLDDGAALAAFRAGQIDYRREHSAQNWSERYDVDAVRDGRVTRAEPAFDGPKIVQTFVMNLRRKKFQDRRTRAALDLAFDFEWSNKVVYQSQYARPRSYSQGVEDQRPEGSPEGLELALLEELREQLPAEVFGPAYIAPVSDGSGRNRRNLRQAQKLLAEAGWRQSQDGALRDAAGAPFTIEFLVRQENLGRVVEPYLRNLGKLGIETRFRVVDTPQYIRRVTQDPDFDFDMIVLSFINSESLGNEQREFWGSESAMKVGGRNISGVADPAVDALIDKIIHAEDRETLSAASRALDRVLTWNRYRIFNLYTPYERLAWWSERITPPDPLPPRGSGFPDCWWSAEAGA